MVVLFLPFSALDKMLNFKQAVGQCAQAIRLRALATVLIVMALGVEVVMSLAILTGIADRLAAFILAGYCIVTALSSQDAERMSDRLLLTSFDHPVSGFRKNCEYVFFRLETSE